MSQTHGDEPMNQFESMSSRWGTRYFASLLSITLVACGFFRAIPPPVPFNPNDAPAGQGWYCSTFSRTGSSCKRTVVDCAREQQENPGSSACVEWRQPAYCYTYQDDSGKQKALECSMSLEFCKSRSDSWRAPGPSDVDREHVSSCQAIP